MFITMWEKARIFLKDAGQVIMVISLILWGLSSFGPGKSHMQAVRDKYSAVLERPTDTGQTAAYERNKKSDLLLASYAGRAWVRR